MIGTEWRKRGDHEWWLVFKDAPESLESPGGMLWPPSMSIAWLGPGACCHLYAYSNGFFPGRSDDREDDVHYLHICDVDDLVEELQAFKAAAGWKPVANPHGA